MNYAGFWKRLGAYSIDWLILQLVIVVFVYAASAHAQADPYFTDLLNGAMKIEQETGGATTNNPTAAVTGGPADMGFNLGDIFNPLDIAATFLFAALYNILFVASAWQATPGKRWYKMRVINRRDGSRLTLMQSTWRHLACALSALPACMGFVMIGLSPEKAALHDLICNTRVVYD